MTRSPDYHAGIAEFVGTLEDAQAALKAAGIDRVTLEPTSKESAAGLVACWVLVRGEHDPGRAADWRSQVEEVLSRRGYTVRWTVM